MSRGRPKVAVRLRLDLIDLNIRIWRLGTWTAIISSGSLALLLLRW